MNHGSKNNNYIKEKQLKCRYLTNSSDTDLKYNTGRNSSVDIFLAYVNFYFYFRHTKYFSNLRPASCQSITCISLHHHRRLILNSNSSHKITSLKILTSFQFSWPHFVMQRIEPIWNSSRRKKDWETKINLKSLQVLWSVCGF